MTGSFSTKKVLIKITDPWDLGDSIHWQPSLASIVGADVATDTVLLKLDQPFAFRGVDCEYFVASPRLEGARLSDLDEGKEVFCALTRITEKQAKSENPMDLSHWRGGLGIIGGLEPVQETSEPTTSPHC